MPKAKPYSGPVDEKIAAQLLNSTGARVDDVPIGDALASATKRLADIVKRANEELEGNEFAAIVAEHLATKMGRRGNAEISVSETGSVMLDISYDDGPKRKRRARSQRSSSVPLMDELKARAKKLGVDISPFGIKRKKIHEYLQKIESGEIDPDDKPPADTSKKKKKKKKNDGKSKAKNSDTAKAQDDSTAKASDERAQVKTANDPPEEDPGPMSAGPDETKVSPAPDDPKPPKRGFVKTSEAVSSPVVVDLQAPSEPSPNGAKDAKTQKEAGNRRSMRDLVNDASDVDIADLLGSEPPK